MNEDIINLEQLRQEIKMEAEKVASTFGPNGHNVLISNAKEPYFSQDGYHVINAMAQSRKTLGAKLLTDAARRVAFTAGDGTTTTCMLIAKALDHGITLPATKIGLFLENLAVTAKREDILEVATTAAKDTVVGEAIGQLVWDLGPDGYITDVHAPKFKTEIIPGYELPGGAILPQALNTQHPSIFAGPNHLTIYNPLISIVSHTLTGVKSLDAIFQGYSQVTGGRYDRPLILVLADIEGRTLEYLGRNTGRMPIIACSVSEDNPMKRHRLMEDLAFITDTTVYSKLSGQLIREDGSGFKSDFGTCAEVTVNMEIARFISRKNTDKRVEKLKAQEDAEFNRQRISRLKGAIGLIHIGAPTVAATRNLQLAIEDAVRSAQSAMKEGYIFGGRGVWMRLAEEFEEIRPICLEIAEALPEEGSPKDSALALKEAFKTAASLTGQLFNAKYII